MSDLEHSRDLQEKFELYVLALIFTILGLAIQTAKLGSSVPADIMELLGWVSLVASGLVGLSRLEWVPVALKTSSQLQDLRIERTRLQDAADAGVEEIPVVDAAEPVDVQELIISRDSSIERGKVRLDRIEHRIYAKYAIHKWTFAAGLLLLMGARAYVPLTAILGQHSAQAMCSPQDVKVPQSASSPSAT